VPKPQRFELLERRYLFVITIPDTQPAALDQPRINAFVQVPGDALPLGVDFGTGRTFNIEAFYDTGASGVLLSDNTTGYLIDSSPELRIYQTVQNPNAPQEENVIFSDVGVAGADQFYVSTPLKLGLANYNQADQTLDIDNDATFNSVYNQQFTPIRTQIGPITAEGDDSNPLLADLDVFGTPLMQNKVVVMDPRPVNSFEETMKTYVYNPGTAFNSSQQDTNPGIPATSLHVKLSYGDFTRFTKLSPANSVGPSMSTNPFIGSNPVRALDGLPSDGTPPVVMNVNGTTTTGSFLLDTGAAASIISTAKASQVNVRYRAGTYGTDNPILEYTDGTTVPDQYQLSIGGIGGTVKLAGFYMTSLSVPTEEGQEIRFTDAPVLVGDIAAKDDKGTTDTSDDQVLTLDGIFGMNFLIASIFVAEGPPGELPSFGDPVPNAFDWLVYDSVNGKLGLEPSSSPNLPNPRVTGATFDFDSGLEQSLTFSFSKDVGDSFDETDLQLQNLTSGQMVPAANLDGIYISFFGHNAIYSFPGYPGYLPDGNYRASFDAASLDDGTYTLAADYAYQFFFLNGDATRDRIVDTRDFNVLAHNFGEEWIGTFTTGDFNYDGDIDSSDFDLLVSQYGKVLPLGSSALVGEENIVLDRAPGSIDDLKLAPRIFLSPGLQLSGNRAAAPSVSALPGDSLFSQVSLSDSLRDELLA
jgi:hypothetical protein